jgi:hypothetical protein
LVVGATGRFSTEGGVTERTIRFYVSKAVVSPPFGKGPGSAWGYLHLVELLAAIFARESEDSLQVIAARRNDFDFDELEGYVGARLGGAVPPPTDSRQTLTEQSPELAATTYPVVPGIGLQVGASHPLLRDEKGRRAIIAALAQNLETQTREL